jgi:uncharacterized membrane protein YfcA
MMLAAGYLLAALMGLTLGFIGAGGSILAVPILVYFMDISPVTATGYSLLIVGLTALVGMLSYHYQKQIDYKVALLFAVPSVLAVYVSRRFALPAIPDVIASWGSLTLTKDIFIMLLFAGLMITAAILMINNGSQLKTHTVENKTACFCFIVVEGILVGMLTGLVGAGGGFLIIPALVLLTGLDMKTAVGTSLAIITIKSLIGFIGDLQVGIEIDYRLLGLFLGLTVTGMLVGSWVSRYISSVHVKKIFGWFTLCMGIIIVFVEI